MKKWLAILLAVVLCLSFVACTQSDNNQADDANKVEENNQTEENNTVAENNGETAQVPTEEGKITYFFTLDPASVQQEDYVSYFVTGGAWGWATNLDALAFTHLEGTDIYYAISDAIPDPAAEQGLEYQLKVGYNENSAAPASELGLTWSNDDWKSEQSNVGGLDNPSFSWAEGQNTVDLGTHTFTTKVAAPETVSTTLVVKFKEALPEGYQVAIYGGINNWALDNSLMATEDNKVFKLAFTDLVAQTYDFKVVVYEPGQLEQGQWTGVQFGAAAVQEGNAENAQMIIGTIDDGEELELFDGKELEYAKSEAIDCNMVVVFDKALEEGTSVRIFGDFNGWADVNAELTTEDNTTWKLAVSGLTVGEHQFKVLTFVPGTTEFNWDTGVAYGAGEGNMSFDFTADHAGQDVAVAEITVQ